MNLYPALACDMGTWSYYVVKMSMRELSENVKFGSEIYEDRTLDEAIQRTLNETRVKKEIVTYLKKQPDRFFSSVVIAALKGDPKFYAVEIADDPRLAVFRDDKRLNSSFGVLTFDGTQDYYALDGQHRLAAIKTLLNKQDPLSDGAPEEFQHDEISVVVVVPKTEEPGTMFMRRYRRLFSNLNRYAKATDARTNIIMDEDDAFAILTRRLIMEHEFFMSPGRALESRKVKCDGGKNLKETDAYFTSLETLYGMNKRLLNSRKRSNKGWDPDDEGLALAEFERFRPDEDYLDGLYDELCIYWNGLLEEIPDLHNEPVKMRRHSLDPDDDSGEDTDHLLFWPIGQEMLADLARDLMDHRMKEDAPVTLKGVREALQGLGQQEWRLHQPPWRYFLLTQDENTKKWRMRSEERTDAVRIGRRIMNWLLWEELDKDGVATLKDEWAVKLIPAQHQAERDKMWAEVEAAPQAST